MAERPFRTVGVAVTVREIPANSLFPLRVFPRGFPVPRAKLTPPSWIGDPPAVICRPALAVLNWVLPPGATVTLFLRKVPVPEPVLPAWSVPETFVTYWPSASVAGADG